MITLDSEFLSHLNFLSSSRVSVSYRLNFHIRTWSGKLMFACAFERFRYLRVHDRISYITSRVTYVTLVPRGNETLRRDAMGNAISVVQLWIICVISQNWRPDVRCGDVMTRMLKSTWCAAGASFQEWSIALVGMPEVWPCDTASRSLWEPGLHT